MAQTAQLHDGNMPQYRLPSLSSPKSQIRLVVLHPPEQPTTIWKWLLSMLGQADTLQCDIEVVSIASPPPFEALSYTWGSDLRTHSLFVSGDEEFPITASPILRAMIAWQRRPWFYRVWVLQEFSLAPEAVFVCGSKRVPVDLLIFARQIVDFALFQQIVDDPNSELRDALRELTHNPVRRFFGTRKGHQNTHIGGEIMEASEQVDRLFSLLGLATDTEKLAELGLKADYSVKDDNLVFTRAARALICNGHLELLSLSQHCKTSHGLPSWVPDWRSRRPPLRRSFCWTSEHGNCPTSLFAASGNDCGPPKILPTYDEKVLGLEGVVVDTVDEIRLMCLLSATRRKYDDPQRQEEAYWRIPVGDLEETKLYDVCRATTSYSEVYRHLLAQCEGFEQGAVFLHPEHISMRGNILEDLQSRDMGTKYRARMHEMKDKRPYLTKTGYVGVGPLTIQPGDQVVVFLGAHIPYVLRTKDDKSLFLLGEAYCDGIMDGEIMKDGVIRPFYLI
ncbi:hypothetical protein B0H63DRAFT_537583 [Podospora didyma]|uniref:Heterokaryon incompatibility domain-containing protein n=1 Tax=Podospora didyma TaxID=330526 RepID=A0AAE0NXF8_9PEZI|nr:hypothetical protein B0H63DRAFT_537583 [Podospora didyma]